MLRKSSKGLKLLLLLSAGILLVGCSGTPGIPGSQGPQGSQGEPGSQGPKGDPGEPCSCDTGDSYIASSDIVESMFQGAGTNGNYQYNGKFYSDYASLDSAKAAGHALGVQIAAEGDVLLKNYQHALPLSRTETNVTLFGIRSVRMNQSGFGSGSGGGSPESDILSNALTSAGYSVNPKTLALYHNEIQSMAEQYIREIDVSKYGSSIVSTYASYHDAAIVTLSRTGQEGIDCLTNSVPGHSSENDHYLQLDDNEINLIKHVKKYFGKVIVLINSSNIMQIPELAEAKTKDNLGVDGILWVGSVGQDGVTAIAHILNGDITPSGHTVDLWEKDFTKSPTFTNVALNNQNKDTYGNRLDPFYYDRNGKTTKFATVEYREGIYTGYKYYETAYADAVGEAAKAAAYDNVLYPFGYGLSYTNFEWKIDNVRKTAAISAPAETITMRVWVKNTGKVAGKDVVQIYYSAPYTHGGIEKSATNLAGFAKTRLLQPGESDILTVQFNAQDMASFDWNDANQNGFKGYELENGNYVISLNRNSHEVVDSITRTVDADIHCETDLDTGKPIKPVYTGSFDSTNASLLSHMISRATGLRQPAASSKADRTLDDATLADYESQATYYSYQDKTTDPWYVSQVPTGWTQATDGTAALVTGLSDMSGVPYTEPIIGADHSVTLASDEGSRKWESFMNQFTWEELASMPGSPNSTIQRLGALSMGTKGATYTYGDPDGPINAGGVQFPSNPILAATYNTKIAEETGRIVGSLLLLNGSRGWRGAGADIHRSPFAGRNFEYYSEDGVMSGLIGAEVAKSVTSKGIIAHYKHFFGNDQETYRADYGGVFTWATEQVLREQTAKPFEYIVKRGGVLGLMNSFNRIGKWTQSNNYATHELLLNKEWDFKGSCEGDAWAKQFVPLNLGVRGGDDVLLSSESAYPINALEHGVWDVGANCVKVAANADEYTDYKGTGGSMLSPTHYFAVRKCVQRLLQGLANSSCNSNGFKYTGDGDVVNYTLTKGVYNSIKLSIPGKTNDAIFTFAADVAWPTGMTYNATTGILSGVPTGEGMNNVSATFTADAWVTNAKATFKFNAQSDLMLNGQAIVDGQKYTVTRGTAAVVSASTLKYGNELMITGNSNQRIMNAYVSKVDGAMYNRDEDKSAADIITLGDISNADMSKSLIYGYSVSGLPDGFTVNLVETQVPGYAAGRGSYAVNTSASITAGVSVAAGDYAATIVLSVPYVAKGSNPWMRAASTKLLKYTQAVVIHID